MKEELVVSLVELFDIIAGDVSLIGLVPASNPLQENLCTSLKIDNEIRLAKTWAQDFVNLLIELQFVAVKIQVSKDLILFEEVIADRYPVEEILLHEFHLLLETAEEEEDLGLKGVLSPVLIKTGEKGVVLRLLVNIPGLELGCKYFYKGGFSNPYRSFNSDIFWWAARWFHEG